MRPALAAQPLVIREATQDDIAAAQAIYAAHVAKGLGSFEEKPPDLTEMTRRWRDLTGPGLPYLVVETEGIVRGFAYAGLYRHRSAYRYSVEDSIYVDPGATRRGLGRALLGELIERCTALGYRQIVAVIGDSANVSSIGLHAHLGFQRVGVLHAIGFKFGRLVDSVIMQRRLGPGDSVLPKAVTARNL